MIRVVRLVHGQRPDLDHVAAVFADTEQTQCLLDTFGIEATLAPDELPIGSTLVLGPPSALTELVAVVDRLLGPGGCPWDQAQTHESLKPYLVEEAYEVLDAIDRKDEDDLKEELGDVLLQPVLHGQISSFAGGFSTEDIARTLVEKLIRRHPHVFGEAEARTPEQVLVHWDAIKRQEKPDSSILNGIPKGMPALMRAQKVSKRAAKRALSGPIWMQCSTRSSKKSLKSAEPKRPKNNPTSSATCCSPSSTLPAGWESMPKLACAPW